MQKKKFCKMIKWVTFIGWLFVIFFFSAQVGEESLAISSKFVTLVESLFSKGIFSSIILDVSFFVRKCAHFFVYLILGVLTFILLKEYDFSNRQVLWFSFLFCMFYACSDEFHQLFVIGRSGRLLDVFIDSCGSGLSILCMFFYQEFTKKKMR